MHEGLHWLRDGLSCSQVRKMPHANLSSVLLESPTRRISVNTHLISGCQGPPATGVHMHILYRRNSFHGSGPGRSPRTTNLPNRALLWQAGSTIPRPPCSMGSTMTDQATLARAGLPSLPDQRKFLISRWTWLMQELEKIQQEVIYHIVANST